ncbi:polysaccharide biosynthesis PFTS motif protein [Steroidobacter flavus]|uniref:Polysaccharide biosynthesis PFTS motif protein n=1 Tax=Steroidobacter flavus TaxID=1842136 RepID=A0ABV8T230_9GAMM
MMRGYRYLKEHGQLARVPELNRALTNTPLSIQRNVTAKIIFGAGLPQVELIVRQFLLTRIAGVALNRALLLSLGQPGSRVVHPLPPEWRRVLTAHGFVLAPVLSALTWQGWIALYFFAGVVRFLKGLLDTVAGSKAPNYRELGRYAYFDTLSEIALPKPCRDGRSHDIITWYARSSLRPQALDSLCHGVKGAADRAVDGLSVRSIPSVIPPLIGGRALGRYLWWGLRAVTLAAFDVFRGRWWHAALLGEASYAAAVRANDGVALASVYLFHNSGWIFRPLWTYEAEKCGARVDFYFYSTNCEPFKRPTGYPDIGYGWEAMNWPRYLVWGPGQAEFVRRAVGPEANVTIVGPIWFNTSAIELPPLPSNSVAVFDVQPVRDSYYRTLVPQESFHVPAVANRFLQDIHATVVACGGVMVFKRKRNIGSRAHPGYRHYVRSMDALTNLVIIDPETAAPRLIESCAVTISMPFTSTALIARDAGKPSCYYDSSGIVQADDRAAHGIPIIHGRAELESWLRQQFAMSAPVVRSAE